MARRFKGISFLALTVSGAITTGSWAAETVISEGAARSCFESALVSSSSDQSVATCTSALEAGSLSSEDRAATFVNRGILRERLSDLAGALGDYDQGLAIRPELADAYLDRGAVLIKLNRFGEATADLNKAIALATGRLHVAYYDRGQAREHTGNLSGACADYRQALAIQPNFFPATQHLEVCRYQDFSKTN